MVAVVRFCYKNRNLHLICEFSVAWYFSICRLVFARTDCGLYEWRWCWSTAPRIKQLSTLNNSQVIIKGIIKWNHVHSTNDANFTQKLLLAQDRKLFVKHKEGPLRLIPVWRQGIKLNMDYQSGLVTTPDELLSTAASNGTATSDSPTDGDYEMVRDAVFYALAFIIPIGIVANCLAFMVIGLSYMCRGTTGHYLLSLALADTTILLGEFLLWLNTRVDLSGTKLGTTFYDSSNFWCHFVNYVRYSGRLWSSWVTVIITAERYITIAFPLRVGRISTPCKAKVVIIVEILLSFALASFVWFTLEIGTHKGIPRCLISDHDAYKVLSITIMGFGELVIPSVIVCIFTGLIIRKLSEASRNRKRQLEGQRMLRLPSSVSQERQLTYILLAVAITFVLVRLPYVVTYYVNEYKEELWSHLTEWENFYIYTANKIANVFSVINYCINFFLYCLCGSTFRYRISFLFYYPSGQRLSLDKGRLSLIQKQKQTAEYGP